MDVTLLFQRFAEQSPLIIAGGICIWQLLKMYKEEKALLRVERQERQNEIRELIDKYTLDIREHTNKHTIELKEVKEAHAITLKELNTYIRERDLETLSSLQEVTEAVKGIFTLINSKLKH